MSRNSETQVINENEIPIVSTTKQQTTNTSVGDECVSYLNE